MTILIEPTIKEHEIREMARYPETLVIKVIESHFGPLK
jgi:hypothetical protein